MKYAKENIFLITVAAVSVCGMVVAFGLYIWVFSQVRATITQASLMSEELQLLATQNTHTQTIRRLVRDTQEEQTKLDTYFVNEESLVAFLEDLEDIGMRTGVVLSVESVSVGQAVDKDELLIPLILNVKSTGSFQSVVHTLALLESLPQATQITQARLTQSSENASWNGLYSLSVLQIGELKE